MDIQTVGEADAISRNTQALHENVVDLHQVLNAVEEMTALLSSRIAQYDEALEALRQVRSRAHEVLQAAANVLVGDFPSAVPVSTPAPRVNPVPKMSASKGATSARRR